MLGTFRLFLALMVVVQHLLSIPHLGHFAVHGFFILSGFLMTLIMHQSYGYTVAGVKGFLINRFLRLFPSYWFYLILTIFIVYIVGESFSKNYREFIYLPTNPTLWLQNITMIFASPFPGEVEPRLLPATWALTVELLFYVLIALGLSKNKIFSISWLALSVAYFLYTLVSGMGYEYRYNHILAGTLPFSIGAVLYHYFSFFNKLPIKNNLALSILLFFINISVLLLLDLLDKYESTYGIFYVFNYILSVTIIILLFKVDKQKVKPLYLKVDRFLGDLSYPVYLSHWSIGLLVSFYLYNEPIRGLSFRGVVTFLVATALCLFLGWLSSLIIDKNVDKVRKIYKRK